MEDTLESLTDKLDVTRDYDSPPLHLWTPELSGDIPITIDAKGDWYHNGGRIEREALVRLFASILRREDDDEYYLVTPVEKWRITVEQHALLVTDIEGIEGESEQLLEATLNTGKRVIVGEDYPLFLDHAAGDIAALMLAHGLTAICTRAAWYRLVGLAQQRDGFIVLTSGAYEFCLPTT